RVAVPAMLAILLAENQAVWSGCVSLTERALVVIEHIALHSGPSRPNRVVRCLWSLVRQAVSVPTERQEQQPELVSGAHAQLLPRAAVARPKCASRAALRVQALAAPSGSIAVSAGRYRANLDRLVRPGTEATRRAMRPGVGATRARPRPLEHAL